VITCLVVAHGVTVIFATLWLISEILALIPWIKSNSIFQLLRSFLRALVRKVK
jgi:hypothetical protein